MRAVFDFLLMVVILILVISDYSNAYDSVASRMSTICKNYPSVAECPHPIIKLEGAAL